MIEDDSLLLDFHLGTGTDHMGRSLREILGQDKKWLEETHDYIQWLFPLYVSSQFNPHAPILTDEVREAFIVSAHPLHAKVQANFKTAIDRMLLFYGFMESLPSNPPEVREMAFRAVGQFDDSGAYPFQYHPWLGQGNHNQLRITRMLRSMTLLGRNELAVSFRDELVLIGKGYLSPKTIKFWDEAVVPVKSC